MHLMVRVTPRAGTDAVLGVGPDGELQVRVAAPPVEGSGNEAVRRLLARELRVTPTTVRIEAGRTGRLKRVAVAGVEASDVEARWPGVRVST